MRLAAFILSCCLFLQSAPARAAEPDVPEGWTISKVVVLASSGVRAPTHFEEQLQSMELGRTWKEWGVGAGELTQRGAGLIQAMWMPLGIELRKLGMFPASGCPDPADVYVRSDTLQRTRTASSALLDGIAPECRLGYRVSGEEKDPLFHALREGWCPITSAASAAAQVIASLPQGSLDGLTESLGPSFDLLNGLLRPVNKEMCERYSFPNCHVDEMPSSVTVSPTGNRVVITGGLGMASGFSELFIMEYSQGPEDWNSSALGPVSGQSGMLSEEQIGELWNIPTLTHGAVNRAPVVAQAQASGLLSEIASALSGTNRVPAVNRARLVVFMGSENNVGRVAGLAGFSWKVPGIRAETPLLPGCSMAFELWNTPSGPQVRCFFITLSIRALHEKIPVAVNGRYAVIEPLVLPGFGEDGEAVVMPLSRFEKIASSRVRNACVPPEPSVVREVVTQGSGGSHR